MLERCSLMCFVIAKDASHESFAFISSTFGIWKMHSTKASFSHLQLFEFERSIAWKLCFVVPVHGTCVRNSIVLCNSLFAGRSGMAASMFLVVAAACIVLSCFSAVVNCIVMSAWDLQMLLWQQLFFLGWFWRYSFSKKCLENRVLRFGVEIRFWSIVLRSSTAGIWRMYRTKASSSQLQLLEVKGSIAQKLRFVEPACVEAGCGILFCFATHCLQIAVEWLRQGSALWQLHA